MPLNPDPNYNFRNILTSNLTGAALWKEHEERLALDKPPLVDLRTIPREQWLEYFGRDVMPSPEIQKYLDGREPGPLSQDEVQMLEIAMEKFHGITEPFYITMGIDLQTTGRTWTFIPEAAPYMSGFEFQIED